MMGNEKRHTQGINWSVEHAQTKTMKVELCDGRAVSSALLAIWPPRNTNKEVFVFEPAFFLLNTKKRKPSWYLCTASTAEQPSTGPAQSSKVHTVVLSCGPVCKQARKSKSGVAETIHVPSMSTQFFMFLFYLFL